MRGVAGTEIKGGQAVYIGQNGLVYPDKAHSPKTIADIIAELVEQNRQVIKD